MASQCSPLSSSLTSLRAISGGLSSLLQLYHISALALALAPPARHQISLSFGCSLLFCLIPSVRPPFVGQRNRHLQTTGLQALQPPHQSLAATPSHLILLGERKAPFQPRPGCQATTCREESQPSLGHRLLPMAASLYHL